MMGLVNLYDGIGRSIDTPIKLFQNGNLLKYNSKMYFVSCLDHVLSSEKLNLKL